MTTCKSCGQEIKKEEFIVIDGWAYETKTHDFNKNLIDIKIPKGKQLWEVSDFEKFSKEQWEELGLLDDWFYIKQWSKYWEAQGRVAVLIADPGGANLVGLRVPQDESPSLGVRFKWKVKR